MGRCRLLAIDIDGTLLDGTGPCSEPNRYAIAEAVSAGIDVVFVTARPWQTVALLAADCNLDGVALCSLGAIAYDLADASVIGFHQLSKRAIRATIDCLRGLASDVAFGWVTPSGLHLDTRYPTTAHGWSRAHLDALLYGTEPVVHLFARTAGAPPNWMARASADLDGRVECASWSNGVLDVTAAGVTKLAALESLCRERSIPRSSVVAIGDSPVDVPMIEWAGTGVAVSNAAPDVRDAADLVVAACVDDGVDEAIHVVLRDRR